MDVGYRPVCAPAYPRHAVSGRARGGGWWSGQAARAGGARRVAGKAPVQASCEGQLVGRCQVIWLRPLRAGRAATWMSSWRMVALRALACRVEASVPTARVKAWAVT